jgi:flagellar biosynthesis/type III secretory pathway protein FliH
MEARVAASDTAPLPAADLSAEYAAAFGAIRRFRAGVADALDAAVQRLLEEIAENVLARELRIAPPDVAAIVAKARDSCVAERVLGVRLHPSQRDALGELEVQSICDDRLSPGDIVIELRSGTIDLRLRTRLAAALAAIGP